MDALKVKLTAMREECIAAEEREEKAKNMTRNCKERIAKAEDAAAGFRRKIKELQRELERIEDRTDLALNNLERVNKQFHDNEMFRRELERREMTEDCTLVHLESTQKSRKLFAQEAEQRHREAWNKLRMLEAAIVKIDARIRTAISKERNFESKLDDAGRTAGSLAKSGEFKQAKCDEYDEKCRFLKDKKDRVLIAAECLERKAMQLEKHVLSLRNETSSTKMKNLNAKKELRDLLDEMNTSH